MLSQFAFVFIIVLVLNLPSIIFLTLYSKKYRNIFGVASIQYEFLKKLKAEDPIGFRAAVRREPEATQKILDSLFYGEINE